MKIARMVSLLCALLVAMPAGAQSFRCTDPISALDPGGARLEELDDAAEEALPGATTFRYGPFKEYELKSVTVSMLIEPAAQPNQSYKLRTRVAARWDDGERSVWDLTPIDSFDTLPTPRPVRPEMPILSFELLESRHTTSTYFLDLRFGAVGRFSCDGYVAAPSPLTPHQTTSCNWDDSLKDFDCTVDIESVGGIHRTAQRRLALLSQRELPVDVGEHPWFASIDEARSVLYDKRHEQPVVRGIGSLSVALEYSDVVLFVADGTTQLADARFFVFNRSSLQFDEVQSRCIGDCPANEQEYSTAWKAAIARATPLPAKLGFDTNTLGAICGGSSAAAPARLMFERDGQRTLYWIPPVSGHGTDHVLRVATTAAETPRAPSLSSVTLTEGCEVRASGTLERGDCSLPVVITLQQSGFVIEPAGGCSGPPHAVTISNVGELGAPDWKP
jgi:hypothetical protein